MPSGERENRTREGTPTRTTRPDRKRTSPATPKSPARATGEDTRRANAPGDLPVPPSGRRHPGTAPPETAGGQGRGEGRGGAGEKGTATQNTPNFLPLPAIENEPPMASLARCQRRVSKGDPIVKLKTREGPRTVRSKQRVS